MAWSTSRVERLIWVLVYGGLFGVALGLAVQRSDAWLGWTMVGVGAVVALAGAVLVWVRSRMRDEAGK